MDDNMSDIQPAESTAKKSNWKTWAGVLVLALIIFFIGFRLITFFQDKEPDSYALLLHDYYSALSRSDTNRLSQILSVDFKDELTPTLWHNHIPSLYIYEVSDLAPTNTVNASRMILYSLVSDRYHTSYLNRAYFLKTENITLITYIDNLYTGKELKRK